MLKQRPAAPADTAPAIALSGLAFLAEDMPRLGRFLALTGIGPEHLREAASAPETQLAVLDHLLADESLLLVFAASKAIPPEAIAPARAALARSLGQDAADD